MPALNTKVAPPSAGVAFNLLTAEILSLSKENVYIGNVHTHTHTHTQTLTYSSQKRKQNNAEK